MARLSHWLAGRVTRGCVDYAWVCTVLVVGASESVKCSLWKVVLWLYMCAWVCVCVQALIFACVSSHQLSPDCLEFITFVNYKVNLVDRQKFSKYYNFQSRTYLFALKQAVPPNVGSSVCSWSSLRRSTGVRASPQSQGNLFSSNNSFERLTSFNCPTKASLKL